MKTKQSASANSVRNSTVSLLPPIKFKVARAFKALDDGAHRKWIVVAAARDLPGSMPLDANARTPNILKNKHCREMRKTLIEHPQLWQVLNSGIICTATSVEVRQEGDSQFVEVIFEDGTQGIVNGGHSYAQLINFIHGNTSYSGGKELRELLSKDAREDDDELLRELAADDDRLEQVMAHARDKATVQMEFVAPIAESDLLTQIARARNLSQPVEDTAFQNLAGRFELMKEVLASAGPPFGHPFVERVVWKTNQEVPDDSPAIPVKSIIHVLALMNARQYPPSTKSSAEVYARSGLVVRDFGESEGDERSYYEKLQRLLPVLLKLYDHIYFSLPEIDPLFPWADGKTSTEKQKRKNTMLTPFLARPSTSKAASGFVWPIYSSMRALLVEQDSEVRFIEDPFEVFEEVKQDLVTRIKNFHQNQAHGLTNVVGRSSEIWTRLDGIVENELKMRQRFQAAKKRQ
jgi:hypothetical protein